MPVGHPFYGVGPKDFLRPVPNAGGVPTKSGHYAVVCGLVAAVLMLQIAVGGYPVAFEINAKAAPPPPVLNIGFLQTIDSLNPYIGLNDASYLLYGLIYDLPYAFYKDGNYVPKCINESKHTSFLMT